MSEIITIEKLSAKNLPELKGWKTKQIKLVKDNPFVEITDNKSYEIGKKHRTALLKGRTSLSNQDKLIASKLKEFRGQVSDETKILIDITFGAENKQQEEVKKYEAIIEEKRLEKQRVEDARVEVISERIKSVFRDWYTKINVATFEQIDDVINAVELFFDEIDNSEFDEFDIILDDKHESLKELCTTKKGQLVYAENQRLEDLRLKKEREDIEKEKEKQRKIQEKELEKRRLAQQKIDEKNQKKQLILDRKERDLKKEKIRLERIEIDRLSREEKQKQIDEENKKLADAKKRAAALKPDLVKLEETIRSIDVNIVHDFKTNEAVKFYGDILDEITSTKKDLLNQLNSI